MAERRLEVLASVMHDLAEATIDYPRLLATIVRRVAEILGVYGSISLLSADRQRLDPAAAYHVDPSMRAVFEALAGRAPLQLDRAEGRLAQLDRGEPIHLEVTDEQLMRRFPEPADLEVARGLGVKGVVIFPLRVHGETIGALTLVRHGVAAAPLTEVDLNLAKNLADHAALAVNNARLLQESQRKSGQLHVLTEASRAFAASISDLPQLLEMIARRVGEVIGELCVIRLLDPEQRDLMHVGGLYHPDPAIAERARAVFREHPLRISEGVSGRVAPTGVPVLLPVVEREDMIRGAPAYRALIEALDVASVIAVPLAVGTEVLGVLSMSRSRSQPPYDREDLELAHDIATHAALALRNAILLDSVRSAEHQMRQAQKMEAVGRLAGGVAHDFNNMLSVILSYSQMMMADLHPGEPMRETIAQVQMAGQRALALTRQLLAFSRRQVLEPKVLDLGAILRQVEPMLKRLIREDIELTTIVAAELHPCKVDAGQIEQVLMNLVVNARDAMPLGGKLTIEVTNAHLDDDYARAHPEVTPGPHVAISVTDTGTGMDAETQTRIFEPFFTTKPKGEGTGLGLSTVFGIVKQSGGSIWVYSELGAGTTFKIYFPRSDEAMASEIAEPPRELARGSETVLLVEDESQVRVLARLILTRAGYHVLEASNGGEALLICEQHAATIHLLLTDVVMPRMSGRELATRLAEIRPDMKVLYMSGYTENSIVHHGVLDSNVQYLPKPITPRPLLAKVRAVLDGRQV